MDECKPLVCGVPDLDASLWRAATRHSEFGSGGGGGGGNGGNGGLGGNGGRGLHSFTLQLNLSNSRTPS